MKSSLLTIEIKYDVRGAVSLAHCEEHVTINVCDENAEGSFVKVIRKLVSMGKGDKYMDVYFRLHDFAYEPGGDIYSTAGDKCVSQMGADLGWEFEETGMATLYRGDGTEPKKMDAAHLIKYAKGEFQAVLSAAHKAQWDEEKKEDPHD